MGYSKLYKALDRQRNIREHCIKSQVRFILNNPFMFAKSFVQFIEKLGQAASVFRNGKWQGANNRGKTKEKAYTD